MYRRKSTGTPFFSPDVVIVKFNSFWTIELEQGYSLFATHPVNRADLPFRLLTGLVDCDRFCDVGVLFPAFWVDPEFEGVLPRGTAVAQCFAVERRRAELCCHRSPMRTHGGTTRLAGKLLGQPGVYRKQFRVRRGTLSAK